MHFTVIAVGKIKEKYLKLGIQEYLKRLQPYAKLEIIEVPDEPHAEGISPQAAEQIKEKEAVKINQRIKPGTFLICLDAKGKQFTSEELASYLNNLMLTGKSNITMVIGGSLGLSKELLKKSDLILSFSKQTFPHQLMRLILLEQIYRCFKIIRDEPYHK